MNYQKLGVDILALSGGKQNVSKLTHCATRLRFEFNDSHAVQADAIAKLPGVISVVDRGGQFQVVIGNDVQITYRAILNEIGEMNGQRHTGSKEQQKKGGIFSQIISVISTTFTPVIPAITGAGMIKALLAILKLTGLISADSTTYRLLDTISDAAFFFLPVLLAYGASIKFACNPILAMTIAGALLHPNLAQLLASGGPISFIGIPVRLADYAGSVLPIILTVWIMSYIEQFAEKISPSMIKFFTKPMIVLLFTAPLALVVIGPFGILLNDLVASGAAIIDGKASWLIPMLMGGLQPFLVITGTAWAMTPIATSQLTRNGFEMINGPGMLASNIAQGAATLCVAFKTKNKNLKQLASSAGFTALLGITEPSLYGVTLKLKKPLIAAMIGGGCAGIYAGLAGLVRYAFVSPGLAALPAFIGENPMNIVHALITCAIAIVVTFALTWIMGFDDPVDETDNAQADSAQADPHHPAPSVNTTQKSQAIAGHTEPQAILSPLSGKLVALNDINDDVFSQGLLGQGVAIIPDNGEVVAPVSGEIITFLESKHAVGIRADNGLELLIHVGLDTVNLNGKHFTGYIKPGDRVTAGDKLISFDLHEITRLGYDPITPVVIINSDGYASVVCTVPQPIAQMDTIINVNA
ncbi:beta-glucoside-specific PTS transporter subunit IIABC [Pectobacterium parmentieri]|uniref:beta-glucoside-specific PTS transporter subunit IIABC n=1 Tax=Pectobacterium parmentieri TaxID=1905730 RepID=UPI000CDDA5DB|nr:beta-glucoside-specific PTS transporter subunit IIABC [Pectobacterium parmentieri]AYH04735.1 PTS beta-glucoside transporter subunit EIIBCA [Pectobacterium parmentieri]AYH13556.1 PTS beta-glucoside transporter subunit EIIBCA [Pectobacterium parmentieri]AYH22258.1 PTS beta-glucoside transporter subunit EIIBCA [Pectobacterium parmentieri]MBN3180249.1 PTS glucose transporter subunit IIA [Pectobacterium parmentieri]POW29622.1 PTS beta-glucoside transporter subunit EIIBCA [Pectobacterium parmenti